MAVVDLERINALTEGELDTLAQRLELRRRAPAPPGPLVNVRGEVITPFAAATGRIQVAPGQTIASTWGNTAWDQTQNVFASAADRDAQWPAPLDGARCFLLDTLTPWIRRGGAWHGSPAGFVVSATGPATQTDCGSAGATAVTTPGFAVTAGRRYRATCFVNGSQVTATGGVTSTNLSVVSGPITVDAGNAWISYNSSVPTGTVIIAGPSYTLTATGTGNAVLKVTGSASSGALRFGANSAALSIEDIGG